MKKNDDKQQIKVEYDEGLSNYFKDLKKYKPLKKDEERKLLIDYKQNNDMVARQKLITSNLRYACSLVNKYSGQGIPMSDLIEEANCGLIESIDKFDLSNDVKVITYAKWNMEYKMQEAIRQKNKIKESDLPDYNDDNSMDLLSDTDDVNDSSYLNGCIDTDDDNISNFYDDVIKKSLEVLTDKEKDFISMYYGVCDYNKAHTYEEIGNKYGITKERVRQIIEKSMRKLRVQVLTLS